MDSELVKKILQEAGVAGTTSKNINDRLIIDLSKNEFNKIYEIISFSARNLGAHVHFKGDKAGEISINENVLQTLRFDHNSEQNILTIWSETKFIPETTQPSAE